MEAKVVLSSKLKGILKEDLNQKEVYILWTKKSVALFISIEINNLRAKEKGVSLKQKAENYFMPKAQYPS